METSKNTDTFGLFQNERQNEHNDCAVRAVATLTCMNYQKVHEVFESNGRKNRKGTSTSIVLASAKELGLNLEPLFELSSICNPNGTVKRIDLKNYVKNQNTLNHFKQNHPTGWYLLQIKGHMFALVDGIQYDNRIPAGDKSKVLSAWKVVF
jgi:hypothetical protein